MPVIEIKSRIRDYSVSFSKIEDFLLDAEKRFKNKCYVIDENVWKIYEKTLLKGIKKPDAIILQISEDRKLLETVLELCDKLIEHPAKRNITLISIGGGITQDITGFVASTLYRGINWIFIPTTLLAQADSCIGGKTSLNYKAFKNLLGTFYPPSELIVDSDFLLTQNDADFYSGLGEVIKMHILNGENSVCEITGMLPDIMKKNRKALLKATEASLLIKKSYIEGDEFDTGRRNMLNFGHTFGHAIEAVSNFEIPHGQAILVGMMMANSVSKKRGILSEGLQESILNKLLIPALKVKLKKQFLAEDALIGAMKKDKKRTGNELTLILMSSGYKISRFDDVKEKEIKEAIKDILGVLGVK